MTIGERIKKVRRSLDLTQQEFADKLGIKRNTVATYETGKSNPSDAAVILICKIFNVNESWLREGSGEMFVQQTREEEIAAAVNRLLSGESTEFKTRLVKILADLGPREWGLLEDYARRLVQDGGAAVPEAPAGKIVPPGYSSREELEREVNEEVERYRQQLLSERGLESQASSANGSDAG